jgi:PIN domain nuclease of toxin-antitoxin system
MIALLQRIGVPVNRMELPITDDHTEQLLRLSPIHNDPFDRMLTVQNICEPLLSLTSDAILARYWDGVKVVS